MALKAFKLCGCGRAFSLREWDALPLVGHQAHEPDKDGLPPFRLEYRNCPCGSTLTIYLAPFFSDAGLETYERQQAIQEATLSESWERVLSGKSVDTCHVCAPTIDFLRKL